MARPALEVEQDDALGLAEAGAAVALVFVGLGLFAFQQRGQ